MPCLVAFAVLAIMGIFSSMHRALAREALSCMKQRVTLRPCDTGFQEKVQGRLIGWLMRRSVRVARFVRRYFEWLTWLLFLLTVWSLYATAVGLYNFYFYGSCDGLNASSFCVLDPAGSNNAFSGVDIPDDVLLPPCGEGDGGGTGLLSALPLTKANYPTLTVTDSTSEVIFIGCFECENTRNVFPTITRLMENTGPQLIFVHHPTKTSTSYLTAVTQCLYEHSAGDEWWDAVALLMSTEATNLYDPEYVYARLAEAGHDTEALRACVDSDAMQSQIAVQRQEVVFTGIYGTPLIFVDETPIVGPKPYRVYRHMLK